MGTSRAATFSRDVGLRIKGLLIGYRKELCYIGDVLHTFVEVVPSHSSFITELLELRDSVVEIIWELWEKLCATEGNM